MFSKQHNYWEYLLFGRSVERGQGGPKFWKFRALCLYKEEKIKK